VGENFKMPQYNICPVAKPRMTRADKWLKRPATAKYWHFVDLCRLNRVELPCFGAHVTFVLPMPKSMSEKRTAEMNEHPHMNRPDLSNIIKSLEDAVYKEDSVIYDLWATKIWGYEGKIIIEGKAKG